MESGDCHGKIVEWTLAYRDKGDLYALMCRQIEAFTCEPA